MAAPVTAASSATGKSLVPAVTTSTCFAAIRSATAGRRYAVRAMGLCSMPTIADWRGSTASSASRVTSRPSPRSAIRREIPTTCATVFPAPKITSGKPCRRVRW
jgi:hypothetical protein